MRLFSLPQIFSGGVAAVRRDRGAEAPHAPLIAPLARARAFRVRALARSLGSPTDQVTTSGVTRPVNAAIRARPWAARITGASASCGSRSSPSGPAA